MIEYLVMLSLLLHLYQPSYQDKQIFKRIADESYIPLIRFLKANKNFKVTLNTPLSFLESLDKFGYNSMISDLHFLLDRKQVELVGSGAYHPLLPKIPNHIAEKEIILNEYGLGYYFGRRQGFEGENAILVSNINGFFPPELAINNDVLRLLDSLGYRWVLVDHTAVLNEKPSAIYSVSGLNIKVIVRNSTLSNMLAFSRSSDIENLKESLLSSNNHVLAMDGETFGHHNRSGIDLLYSLMDTLTSVNIQTATCSEYLSYHSALEITGLSESTWSTYVKEGKIENTYPLWASVDNTVQSKQWELLNLVNSAYNEPQITIQDDQYANKPLWHLGAVVKDIKDPSLVQDVLKEIILLRLQNSDQFFWSSNVTLPLGEHLYDKVLLSKSLNLFSDYKQLCAPSKYLSELEFKINELRQLI